MPSTYSSLHIHVVFSTKDRVPVIASEWRERLYAFIGGTVIRSEAIPEAIGGTENHIHLLLGIRPTHCPADLVREIKVASSRWIHGEIGRKRFARQQGNGVFSVGPSTVAKVRGYIDRQEEHHRRGSFQDEFVLMLQKAGVEFEERFLW